MCVPEWEHPASLWPPPAFSFESGSFEPWPPRFGVRFVSSCRHREETYQRNVERLEKRDDAGRDSGKHPVSPQRGSARFSRRVHKPKGRPPARPSRPATSASAAAPAPATKRFVVINPLLEEPSRHFKFTEYGITRSSQLFLAANAVGIQGTAPSRCGLISFSHSVQCPNVPALMRLRASSDNCRQRRCRG